MKRLCKMCSNWVQAADGKMHCLVTGKEKKGTVRCNEKASFSLQPGWEDRSFAPPVVMSKASQRLEEGPVPAPAKPKPVLPDLPKTEPEEGPKVRKPAPKPKPKPKTKPKVKKPSKKKAKGKKKSRKK